MSQAPMRPIQRSEQRTPMRRVIRNSLNRFEIDMSKIPPGMTVEWKCKTIMGAENIEGQINNEANGWTAVPPERHPELTGTRMSKDREIVRSGLVLMERPKEITEQSREIDDFEARRQVANQMQRLRATGQRAAGRGIRTTYELPPQERQIQDDA